LKCKIGSGKYGIENGAMANGDINDLANVLYVNLSKDTSTSKQQKTMRQFLPTLLTKIINFDPVILVNAIQSLAKVAVYLFYPIFYPIGYVG
jgi:hypothetical protein